MQNNKKIIFIFLLTSNSLCADQHVTAKQTNEVSQKKNINETKMLDALCKHHNKNTVHPFFASSASSLFGAIKRSDYDAVVFALEHGAPVNAQHEQNTNTPLMEAIDELGHDILEVEHKADMCLRGTLFSAALTGIHKLLNNHFWSGIKTASYILSMGIIVNTLLNFFNNREFTKKIKIIDVLANHPSVDVTMHNKMNQSAVGLLHYYENRSALPTHTKIFYEIERKLLERVNNNS